MGKVVNHLVMTVVGFGLLLLVINVGKCSYTLFDDTPSKIWPKSEAKSEANTKASAVTACRRIVRLSAVFGSKADFNGWSRRYGYIGTALAVQEEVELMNGLGLMIPHTYRCAYENSQAKLIWLRRGTE